MRPLQLVELHDLPWFPAAWRDPFTDFMAFYSERLGPYSQVHPVLQTHCATQAAPPVAATASGT